MTVIERFSDIDPDLGLWQRYVDPNPSATQLPVIGKGEQQVVANTPEANLQANLRRAITDQAEALFRRITYGSATKISGGLWDVYTLQTAVEAFQGTYIGQPSLIQAVPWVVELLVDRDDLRAEYLRRMLRPEPNPLNERDSWPSGWQPCSGPERAWLRSWQQRLRRYPETVEAIRAVL